MRLDHGSISNEQIAVQVFDTPEHSKRIKDQVDGKLLHKSAFAEAFERAAIEVARREMQQAN